jgi:glycerophosphoryl diester phosphodiesterase
LLFVSGSIVAEEDGVLGFILGFLGAILLLWILFHLLEMFLARWGDRTPFVVGHRGAAGLAPENTIPAIETGIRRGVGAIEVDVHRTKDGRLVVMHDTSVERTTDGSGEIRDLTWDQVRSLDAGGYFSSSYVGTSVPLLSEVIDRVIDAGCRLVVEVKDPVHYPDIAQDLAGLLKEKTSELADDVIVISFDIEWLRDFHNVAPNVSLGQLHLWGGGWPEVPGTLAVDIYWRSVILDPTLIWRARRRGYQCWVWTVNKPWAARLLWMLGVEAVTTDRPDLIRIVES